MAHRYKLLLEYDGGSYVGWQRQDNGPSIQASLEEAVLRFCGDECSAVAAGRTDAGVHALGMVVHIDLSKDHDARVVREAINFHLKPKPIAVLSAERVCETFHARFSARARHYLYRVLNRRAPLALEKGRVWRISGPLDADAMHKGAQHLIGKHDFSTFRATQCQSRTPIKTLSEIACVREGEEILMRVCAPSFLHHQVRSIAGSLIEVGLGKWSPDDILRTLKAADRSQCGQVAPAYGLYFVRADYDEA